MLKKLNQTNQEVADNAELESLVAERTEELLIANEKLKTEVAELKYQKELLLLNKERCELAVEASQDGLWDWNWETNEVFFSANWISLLGFKKDELADHFEMLQTRLHPEDHQRWQNVIAQDFNDATHYELEDRWLHKDGDYRTLLVRGKLWRDHNGKLTRFVALGNDITQLKQKEEALQESENRLQSIIDNTSTIIYVKDIEGRYILINRQYELLFNLEREKVKGQTDCDIFPLEIAEALMENDRKVLASGTSWEWEEDVMRPDGLRTYLSLKYILHDANGVAYALCGMSTDITERKQAETALRESETQLRQQAQQLEQTLQELQQTQAQLIQTEKMSSLGQMVAGVAHEINNPVNFIYGNLTHVHKYTENLINLINLYQQHYPNPVPEIETEAEAIELDFLAEDLPKTLNSMKVGTERIRKIILSLRNFSRLDEADMKAVDIHEGIESTLMILQNQLKAKAGYPEIQLIKEYGNLPLVECYAGQLNQVFMNILANAIDALDQYNNERSHLEVRANPSKITIQTETTENNYRAQIKIKDNGIGMPENVVQRIFDPFFTTKVVGKGTGLGLSISYQIIVEKHHGELKCFSEPGKGTEFWIEIPVKYFGENNG
ncbi:MAG: PAS domain S-box protein [Crinalium sp.]